MYITPYSAVADLRVLHDFIRENSFGSLVSTSAGGPSVNHYPFLANNDQNGFALWAHISRSNPQWRDLEISPKCLAIFTGPHCYVSPVYYKAPLNVPTWNYTAVHVSAEAEIIKDESLERELMRKFVAHYEEKNGTNWTYELPEDFHAKLLKAIVWIKLKPTAIEGKFKLSQNRSPEDYAGVVRALEERGSENDLSLLKYMKASLRNSES